MLDVKYFQYVIHEVFYFFCFVTTTLPDLIFAFISCENKLRILRCILKSDLIHLIHSKTGQNVMQSKLSKSTVINMNNANKIKNAFDR